MNQILVPILAYLSIISLGGALLIALVARRQPLKARLLALEGNRGAEPTSAERRRPFGAIARLGEAVSGNRASQRLQEALAQAGYHEPRASAIYLGCKCLLFVAGSGGGMLGLLPFSLPVALKFPLILSSGAILSFVPNILVWLRREQRRNEVRLHLANAIDLQEICVSSGMGLDMAWNAVSDEVRSVSPILADEMALTNLEIHLGSPRAVALRHMAQRTGAEDLSSLVATLVQSERFGTSVTDALRTFASSLRDRRSQRAEESAEKMAVKLLFPLVLCIFPAMLIVVAGPACIEVFKAIGGSK